jgi:putative addiction module component (TIGR02574 family)
MASYFSRMNDIHLSELLKLTPAERIQLAQDLWDSLPEDAVPLTEEQLRELERRLAEHEANPGFALPWSEVRARLEARFGA